MATYALVSGLVGPFMPNNTDEFVATASEAIDALLEEATVLLEEDVDWDLVGQDEVLDGDLAALEERKSAEGRADLLWQLEALGSVELRLESYCNSFGGEVILTRL